VATVLTEMVERHSDSSKQQQKIPILEFLAHVVHPAPATKKNVHMSENSGVVLVVP
jgi:hypothetical protein